jgi:hypothetical protein
MRQRDYGAPPSATKNLESSTFGEGRRVRCDSKFQPWISQAAHGTGAVHSGTPTSTVSTLSARGLYHQQTDLKRLKNFQPGRNHLSVPVVVSESGRHRRYEKCPGFLTSTKNNRSYQSKYKCEQCTMEKGYDFWLCHTIKKINRKQTVVSRHLKYHIEMCFETTTGSATGSSVASGLTDE